jgi:2-oxoisovalerate dehydrogenase E1 component alpha subunit
MHIGEWDETRHAALTTELEEQVDAANKKAQKLGVHGGGPYHDPSTMFEDVYKEMPWHLREQQAELARFREKKP